MEDQLYDLTPHEYTWLARGSLPKEKWSWLGCKFPAHIIRRGVRTQPRGVKAARSCISIAVSAIFLRGFSWRACVVARTVMDQMDQDNPLEGVSLWLYFSYNIYFRYWCCWLFSNALFMPCFDVNYAREMNVARLIREVALFIHRISIIM